MHHSKVAVVKQYHEGATGGPVQHHRVALRCDATDRWSCDVARVRIALLQGGFGPSPFNSFPLVIFRRQFSQQKADRRKKPTQN